MTREAILHEIRDLVRIHARLRVQIHHVADDDNLFVAGLASFAAVQLLIAIEEKYDIEFDSINPQAFSSISSIEVAAYSLMLKNQA